MKKTFKVVMLPTEKASHIHLNNGNVQEGQDKPEKLYFREIEEEIAFKGNDIWKSQHLYITSDEKPKEGDWYMAYGQIIRCENPDLTNIPNVTKGDCKKIIATTDKSLGLNSLQEAINNNTSFEADIQYGLPQLPESLIQVYIKAYNEGKPITEVDLEMGYTINKSMGHFHQVRNYFIKTRPDNTVIVHQSKMYSRSDVVALGGNLVDSLIKELGVKYPRGFYSKWVENNLN